MANVFLINKISDFPTQIGLPADAPTQRLGTDEIQRVLTQPAPLFEDDNGNGVYHPNGVTVFTVALDKNELYGPVDSYNLASPIANGAGGLSDALRVRAGAVLGINSGAERGFGGSGQYAPASSSYAAELCGRMRLLVGLDGRLELGNAQGYTATAALGDGGLLEAQNGGTLRVNAGSVLTIRRGGTLVVRNGGTLLVDGLVRVEDGAFLCVEVGANLVFSPAAELFVDPGATLGTNPALGLPASAGCSGQLAVCGRLTGGNTGISNSSGRNEALQFDGNDAVSIANTSSAVNTSLTQAFAVEAYLRADNLSLIGAQTIFSSRHNSFTTTNGFDGLLFSLYNGGQLLLQLDGRNYFSDANQLPNDNACHHVAVTRDNANRVRFYIDGRETAYSPTTPISAASTGDLNLGADRLNANHNEFFRGMIGEIRAWNAWRSGDQVREGLTTKLVAPQPGLVVYYDMQDPSGQQVLGDLSGQQPAVPGTLGQNLNPGTDDPTWVSNCALACTVQGNFRTGPVSWTPVDSTAQGGNRPARHSKPNKFVTALSISPNPTTTGGTATLHFDQLRAGQVRVWVQDLMGTERAMVLQQGQLTAGPQHLTISTRALPPGLYVVVVRCGNDEEHVRLEVR